MNVKLAVAICLTMPLAADLSIGEMEKMVEKIKAKRTGIKRDTAREFISPFVLIQQDKNSTVIEQPKSSAVEFVLGGLINDKAYLNSRWVKKGDTVEGYEVIDMDDTSVTLIRGEREIKVFLKKSKPILQLNEG